MKAQLCPVCNGKGTTPNDEQYSTSSAPEKVCHGCGGCGWVSVPD